MPDLGFVLGIDLAGTAVLNLMGALIGGICSAFTLHQGSQARITSAIKAGLSLPSFVFFVCRGAAVYSAQRHSKWAIGTLFVFLLHPKCR